MEKDLKNADRWAAALAKVFAVPIRRARAAVAMLLDGEAAAAFRERHGLPTTPTDRPSLQK